jgi:hypothetical protein
MMIAWMASCGAIGANVGAFGQEASVSHNNQASLLGLCKRSGGGGIDKSQSFIFRILFQDPFCGLTFFNGDSSLCL